MMTTKTFDWSTYEGAYGGGADVPERLRAARTHATSDQLRDAVGQLAVFGLDSGHLTEAGAPLAGLLLDEVLIAVAQRRPAWPYCVHIALSLNVGRVDAGLLPTQFFAPSESEAVRLWNSFEQARRQKQVQREVAARLPALLAAVEIAAALDAVHLVALLHSAGLLAADGQELLARLYERLETNAQRASLLLPWAANVSPGAKAPFKRVIDLAAADSSSYLRAAVWAVSQAYARVRPNVAPASKTELLTLIAASDVIENDYVWYEGLLGGVVCQAIVVSSLPRSEQLELLFFCLRREPHGVTDVSMPLAGLAAAAAWQIFRLVFGHHYQRRRPLDHPDLSRDELATLMELRSARRNWLDLGHQYPSQFGIPEFAMEIDHLLEPRAALQREVGDPWPGELERSTLFSWLLRPLQFQRASPERAHAFALVARQLLAKRDDEGMIAALLASARLPGFPCREFCLALHEVGVDPNLEGVPSPAFSDATSFRHALRAWASEPVVAALCELFELRVGST